MISAQWQRIQKHLCDWYAKDFWKGHDQGLKSQAWLRHFVWHMDFLGNFFDPVSWEHEVLDVGGGYMLPAWHRLGMLGFYLNAIGRPRHYTVVEPEREFVEAINELPMPIQTRKMLAEEILDTDTLHGRFQCVLCLGALDHFENPKLAVAGMVKAMTPAGALWIGITVRTVNEPIEDDPHAIHQWSGTVLKGMLEEALSDLGASITRFDVCRPLPMKDEYAIAYVCIRKNGVPQ